MSTILAVRSLFLRSCFSPGQPEEWHSPSGTAQFRLQVQPSAEHSPFLSEIPPASGWNSPLFFYLVRPNRFWRCSQTRPFTDLHVPHQAPNFLEKPLRWPSFWLRGTDSSFFKKKNKFFSPPFSPVKSISAGFQFRWTARPSDLFFSIPFPTAAVSFEPSFDIKQKFTPLTPPRVVFTEVGDVWLNLRCHLIRSFNSINKIFLCLGQKVSVTVVVRRIFFSTQNALFMTTRCRLLNQSTRSRTSCSNVCSSLIITFSFNLIEFQWSSDMQIRGHFNFRFQLIGTDRQRPLIRPHMTSFA